MMAGLLAGPAVQAAIKILMPFAGAAALVAGGFVGGVVYEHKAPWALGPQLTRLQDSIPGRLSVAKLDGARAQTDADAGAFTKWGASLKKCSDDQRTAAQTIADQLDAMRHTTTNEAASAYRLGRATCGANNATPPTGPAAAPGSVRDDSEPDLRDVIAAPAARSPGGVPSRGAPDAGGGAAVPRGG